MIPDLNVLEHAAECAHAARTLRVKLERFQRSYPRIAVRDLVQKSQEVAEDLQELERVYRLD